MQLDVKDSFRGTAFEPPTSEKQNRDTSNATAKWPRDLDVPERFDPAGRE
jgi:hypothetical protein